MPATKKISPAAKAKKGLRAAQSGYVKAAKAVAKAQKGETRACAKLEKAQARAAKLGVQA